MILSRQHRPHEARLLLEGSLHLALEHELSLAALRAYNNVSTFLWAAGRWRPFLANVERALELARRVGDRMWESTFLAGPVGTLMMLGSWDEALVRADEAEALAETEFVRGLLLLAVPIYIHRGAFDAARERLAANESMARSENISWAAGYALISALLQGAEGRREEALTAVERGLALREQFTGMQTGGRFLALEAAGEIADEGELRELLGVVDELHAAELSPFLRAQQSRFRARLPEHDAESELATAERLFAESEMPFYVAVTRLARAEHLLASDESEQARSLLTRARETFERLGARPWLDRVVAAESTAGVLG